jgi:hypothetical protein
MSDTELLIGIRTIFAGIQIESEQTRHGNRIHLPIPNNSDYQYEVACDDGCASIEAIIIDQNNRFLLWNMLWEYFDNSLPIADILSDIKKLSSFPTRIIQKQGLFYYSIRCEILENNQWIRFGGRNVFPHLSFSNIRQARNLKIYNSSALNNYNTTSAT